MYYNFSVISNENFGLIPYDCSNNQEVYLASIDISSIEIISLVFGVLSSILGLFNTLLVVAVFLCFRNDDTTTAVFRTNNRTKRILLLFIGSCYLLCSIIQGLTLLIFKGLICTESKIEGRRCSLGTAGICSVGASFLWFIQGIIVFLLLKKNPSLHGKNHANVDLIQNNPRSNQSDRKRTKDRQRSVPASISIATGIPAQKKVPEEIYAVSSMTSVESGSLKYDF